LSAPGWSVRGLWSRATTVCYVWRCYVRCSSVLCVGGRGGRNNEPAVLVLASLAGGAKHGHALALDIEEFAGVRLGPGSLYGAITRLEERGLIEPLPSDDRRRPYRLTAAGRAELAVVMESMGRVVRTGTSRLGLPPLAPA
jgi:DNA-binding PadR family transcriptional regulator